MAMLDFKNAVSIFRRLHSRPNSIAFKCSCKVVAGLSSLTVLLCHPSPCPSCQQWQLWAAVAWRESGAGQQVELVAAGSGRAGWEDTTSGGTPQAHPLYKGKTKVLCAYLSKGQLMECTNWQPYSVFSPALIQVSFVWRECAALVYLAERSALKLH